MDLEAALAWRDRLIDQYLPATGPDERAALALFLADGEDSLAAMNVPTAIREAQVRVVEALETETQTQGGKP